MPVAESAAVRPAEAPSPPTPAGFALPKPPATYPEGERRAVTVLFADLVGFTSFAERTGEEAAFRLVRRVSSLLAEAVESQGGVVKGFTGDGAIALFGVPSSIEDAPLRACRAGLLILQRLASAGDEFERDLGVHPQIRIGIHTGPVVVGPVATGDAAASTAVGDTVNLAARLERQAPPGAVLLSEATYGLVGGRIIGEFVGQYYLRGKTTPQRVYRLTAIREGSSRFDAVLDRGLTSYVGRSRELTTLEQRFDRARGTFEVVDIVGDPGMGKSRLLYEFRLRLRPKAAYVLTGNCSSMGNGVPYLPFAEVLRHASQIGPDDDEALAVAKLTSTLRSVGLDSPLHRALLMNLLGLAPPADSLSGVDGSLLGIQTRELLRLWLATVGRRTGLVLFIEDLQWIDPASEELLHYLIDTEDPAHLLLVCTRRPEYRPSWASAASVSLLALGPLSPQDTLRLVAARTGADRLPERMGQLIVDKAEGNALFAEEITTLLIQEGIVRHTDAGLQFLVDRTVQLPANLRSLLAMRLDRLEAADKALLQVAAVVGRRFRPDLVAAVAGAPEDPASRLAALQTMDLIYPDSTTGDWWFKHALIRDALYDGVLESRRETLHLHVAEELERRSVQPREVAERLAYHYALTARPDKAFEYLALAGRKSLDLYAIDQAARYCRQALAVLRTHPSAGSDAQLAQLVNDTLEAEYLRSDFAAVMEVAREYLPVLERMGEPVELSRALFFHAGALANQCDLTLALSVVERSLRIAEQCGDLRAQGRAREQVLYISSGLTRTPLSVAESMGRQALDETWRARDIYAFNWTIQSIAWDYMSRGSTLAARVWSQKLIDSGAERNDRRALSLAGWTLGWIDIVEGRYSDAVRHAHAAVGTASTPFDRSIAEICEASAITLGGSVVDGMRRLERLREWTRSHGWLYVDTAIDTAMGAGLALGGEIRRGIQLLERAIRRFDAGGFGAPATWCRITLAEIYLEILSGRTRPPVRFILRNLGAILTARFYGAARAERLLDDAGRNDQFSPDGVIIARIKFDRARLLLRRRQRDSARQLLQEARSAAMTQGSFVLLNQIGAALSALS